MDTESVVSTIVVVFLVVVVVVVVVVVSWIYWISRFKLTKWVTGDMDTESVVRSEEFVEKCNALGIKQYIFSLSFKMFYFLNYTIIVFIQ